MQMARRIHDPEWGRGFQGAVWASLVEAGCSTARGTQVRPERAEQESKVEISGLRCIVCSAPGLKELRFTWQTVGSHQRLCIREMT